MKNDADRKFSEKRKKKKREKKKNKKNPVKHS